MKTTVLALALLAVALLVSGCGEDYPKEAPFMELPKEALAKVSIQSGDIRWGKTRIFDEETAMADILILNESGQEVGWAELRLEVYEGDAASCGGTLVANETRDWQGGALPGGRSAVDEVEIGLPRNLAQLTWEKLDYLCSAHTLYLRSDRAGLNAVFTLKRAANRWPGWDAKAAATAAQAVTGPAKATFARCTGAAACDACTDCSRCAHCSQEGGSCGVCEGGS